jgi:hypothetical protein
MFCEKDNKRPMLPPAKRAFTGCFTRFAEANRAIHPGNWLM